MGVELLISESAGLCNRCSPYVTGILSICIIDNLSGVHTPSKIGPMLKMADIIVITKGDIVSQAEREVFGYNVRKANKDAKIIFINGITGQGIIFLKQLIQDAPSVSSLENRKLRYAMPSATCSYCTGEMKIGEDYQMGNMKKADFFSNLNNVNDEDETPLSFDMISEEFICREDDFKIDRLEILPGHDKDGNAEKTGISLHPGDVISIVGSTGSGKSRLLEDVEYIAQGDTPTDRKILINNKAINGEFREGLQGRIVAQLSQNMNFVMDVSVYDFLVLHAKSRKIKNIEAAVNQCLLCANDLAGEKFKESNKLTELSGGQSKALMISDIAYLSESEIVLIDEIENAGIDRRKAIKILADRKKIVLLATHDPLLALSAAKRMIIRNGGISRVIETSEKEKMSLESLTNIDNILIEARENLRNGMTIECVNYIQTK